MVLSDFFIFLYVQLIFVSIAFWESHIDPKGWAQHQQGWKIDLKLRILTAYHFWCWIVMIPLFLFFPLVIFGWNSHLFWLLTASLLVGVALEDFLWFVFNPNFTLKKFTSKHGHWHKWIKIGKFEVPEFYILFPIIAFLIWLLIL